MASEEWSGTKSLYRASSRPYLEYSWRADDFPNHLEVNHAQLGILGFVGEHGAVHGGYVDPGRIAGYGQCERLPFVAPPSAGEPLW